VLIEDLKELRRKNARTNRIIDTSESMRKAARTTRDKAMTRNFMQAADEILMIRMR
jgi:hypothetical protein